MLELLPIACDQYGSEAKSLGGNKRVQRANCRAGIFESGAHSSVDFDDVMVEQKHIQWRDDCGEQLLFPGAQVRVLCSSLFEPVLQLAQRYDGETNGALAVGSEPVADGPRVGSQQINPDRRVEQVHGGIIPCPDRTSFRDRHAAVGIDRVPV